MIHCWVWGKKNLLLKLNNEKNSPSEDLNSVIGDPDPAPRDTIKLRKWENQGATVGDPGFHCADCKQRVGLWPREKRKHHA